MNARAVSCVACALYLAATGARAADAKTGDTKPADTKAGGVDRSVPPKLETPKPFELKAPVEFTLKNGLKVMLLERNRAPLIDLLANVEAGIAVDPKDLPGVASWTAAMLVEGAGKWDALAFADAEADIGAEIGSSAGIDAATVSLHVTATRFNEGLQLFTAALTQPRVDAADWARVKQNLTSNFLVEADDPQSLAGLAGARAAWGDGHRFAMDSDGTPRSLAKATRDDVLAFHKAHYRPDTTTLIVVGAINKADLTRALEASLGSWTAAGARPATPTLPGPVPVAQRTLVGVQIADAPQTVLRVVGPAPAGTLAYRPDV
jgi:zinc protease